MNRPEGEHAWNYGWIPSSIRPFVHMKLIDNDIHECVLLRGLRTLSLSNSDDPPGSFHTRDLFTPHPVLEDRWKYVGRLDDRVTLLTGEKVLPLPIEGRVRESHLVKEAVVFGIDRAVPGLLLFQADGGLDMSNEQYLEVVWPFIEEANGSSESFSRISREMIVLISPGTGYPQTDKGSIIRAQVYREFAKQINGAYQNLDTIGRGGLKLVDVLTTENYLLETMHKRLGLPIEDTEADLFAAGMDSSRAIQLRALILTDLDLDGRESRITRNIVFETGNVALLARYLYAIATGADVGVEDEIEEMEEMIRKYSIFKNHAPSSPIGHTQYAVVSKRAMYQNFLLTQSKDSYRRYRFHWRTHIISASML